MAANSKGKTGPIAPPPEARYCRDVRTDRNSLLKRIGAIFCVALLFVFTQAAAASIVGNLQHAVVGQHDHQHMIFADISLDAAEHDADHHPDEGNQFHDDGGPADHGPSHHHHHGDLGSSNLVLASLPAGLLLAWHETVVPAPGRLLTDTRQHLPDRPPRTALLRV